MTAQNYIERLKTEPAQNILEDINKQYPTGDAGQDLQLIKLRSQLLIQEQQFEKARGDLEIVTKEDPSDALAWDNLGVIYQMYKAYAHAAQAHRKALEIQPKNSDFAYNLGIAYDRLGKKEVALKLYEAITLQNPDHVSAKVNIAQIYNSQTQFDKAIEILETIPEDTAVNNLIYWTTIAQTYKNLGRNEKALAYYTKAQTLDPENEIIQFAVSALKGDSVDAPPEGFVSSLFNGFSTNFDARLEKELEYVAPNLVMNALNDHLPKDQSWSIVDLGAGTGLFGKLVKPSAQELIGIDISEGMLDHARELNVYDQIICDDIHNYLSPQESDSFDLISAVDVFNYVGRLETVFADIKRTLKPDRFCAFTVEKVYDGDVKLLDTMRFGHSDDYIHGLAEQLGLSVISCEEAQIRVNKGKPIMGSIYLLKK